jgi:hypothetical protein
MNCTVETNKTRQQASDHDARDKGNLNGCGDHIENQRRHEEVDAPVAASHEETPKLGDLEHRCHQPAAHLDPLSMMRDSEPV